MLVSLKSCYSTLLMVEEATATRSWYSNEELVVPMIIKIERRDDDNAESDEMLRRVKPRDEGGDDAVESLQEP